MTRCLAIGLLAAAALSAAPRQACGWGLASHRMIAEQAIETLPDSLRAFLRAHRRELSDLAVEPDTVLRERDGRKETVRHFIDLDLYGAPPFAELPRSYRAAVERYGTAAVQERGTVPWTIEEHHQRMIRELRDGDWRQTVRAAGLAAHYVADATMPLHTTADYDGQKTGSPGIHRAIEHDLVDARLREYRKRLRGKVEPARAAAYGSDQIFALLLESYASLAELRAAEREARSRGSFLSAEYLEALDERAGNLIAARLARAINFLGAFWLSAWQEAGRPALP
ncbi:MAG: zinc dependent phospholipase C family protein [Candidatus Binatia bacterium]